MRTEHSSPPHLILLVCLPGSIQSARWADLLRRSPFRVVIFPSVLDDRCPELDDYPLVGKRADVEALGAGEIGFYNSSLIESIADSMEDQRTSNHPIQLAEDIVARVTPSPSSLKTAILTLQPDLVHSLDWQHASYLCLEARRTIQQGLFPTWMASNWGSDVYLYRKLPSHTPILREIMENLDALHSECARDNEIAAGLGFRGMHFPNVPASGGSDPRLFTETAALKPPSQRAGLLVKGYHGLVGRGQHVVLALHRIAPMLKGFRIRVAGGDAAMMDIVTALAEEDGLDIAIDHDHSDHTTGLARLIKARVVIGCAISDGNSSAVLEAMMTGTFPIESDTGCAREWIESGTGGLIVPAHDVGAFAEAIAKAVTDDGLVDTAAVVNREVVMKRWDIDKLVPIVVQAYQNLFDGVQPRLA